ncbi:MoxR family ATPase [Sphaerisporangium album]|uniref:MoxR family ATPase n=1 Tax=Sphaerisporangium album TaxID=509200 RepID=A0A367FKW1_9ACTN|nr:MoxR family ATPase [Sphaerisporangium album]RCG30462.1 MoxR family ATPase [Sphaerisporangium album]
MTDETLLDELLSAVDDMRDADSPEPSGAASTRRGDVRDGRVYVASELIRTAVKVAIVTGRPLLLSGAPGCGKSSLASYVARNLGLAYHEFTVTDGAQPQELLYSVDTVRRFNDAQLGHLRTRGGDGALNEYIEPGPLWWCLNPETARLRGARDGAAASTASPPLHLPGHTPGRPGAVLLIDEIDKADSSFCNGLLVPLGSRQFFVSAIDTLVTAAESQVPGSPLVMITTNNERDLPDAFIRRCVALSIPTPTQEKLVEVASRHFGGQAERPETRRQIEILAARMVGDQNGGDTAPQASIAEFLDLVQTLLSLKIDIDSEEWGVVQELIIEKRDVRGSRVLEW